jgi:hypothetical protein
MSVDVGDDGKVAALTDIPQSAEVATVKTDDAGVQTIRVEVVVEYELNDPSAPRSALTKQESSAFVLAVTTALSQISEEAVP